MPSQLSTTSIFYFYLKSTTYRDTKFKSCCCCCYCTMEGMMWLTAVCTRTRRHCYRNHQQQDEKDRLGDGRVVSSLSRHICKTNKKRKKREDNETRCWWYNDRVYENHLIESTTNYCVWLMASWLSCAWHCFSLALVLECDDVTALLPSELVWRQ